MITRVVEIGNPGWIRYADRQLVFLAKDEKHPEPDPRWIRPPHWSDAHRIPPPHIPFEDLGVLILDHPRLIITHQALTACAENGVAVLICDHRHLPSGLMLPLSGHTLHAKVIAAQADATKPRLKRLWQRIVQAKIQAQANCLQYCHGNGGNLSDFVFKVRSGDPENLEAQAAKMYWPLMFGPMFRRLQDLTEGDGAESICRINALLNYGYAILRSTVARACCGSGLHPGLGIHHCNQYNPYALADDLMEPLRPLVDETVFFLSRGQVPILDRPTKAILLGILTTELDCDGQKRPFLAGLPLYTASIARVLSGEQENPIIPVPAGH